MSNIVCRSKTCGLIQLIENTIVRSLNAWEAEDRTFLGLDVSSVTTGCSTLRIKQCNVVLQQSVAINLSKDKSIHSRFDRLKNALLGIKADQKIEKVEVVLEEKLLRISSGQKGVIGSHTLAETIAAAHLATYLTFSQPPERVNPRSARSGLGLNNEGSNREKVKEDVKKFVSKHFPSFVWTNKKVDEDRADSMILALMAVRIALKREIESDSLIQAHFKNCHPVAKAELLEGFHKRSMDWVDLVWLNKTFPV